ncbi:MAG: hypothetical protein AB7I36_16385 [Rhodospirillaceae bacterium]
MTSASTWFSAFPIQPATEAVEALQAAWRYFAEKPLPNFNPKTKEPELTKALKIYVENVTARERGLLGMWAAENVIGEVDPTTGKIIEERRTDIVYGWNDNSQSLELVFEFKRLGRQKSDRKHYLGTRGLGRFVSGIYSRRQAVAGMVGVLLDPETEVIPPLLKAFEDSDVATELRLRKTAAGNPYDQPSALFKAADFDTEHERAADLAPTHGHIRVAHFFLKFGYPTSTKKAKAKAKPKA